MAVVDTPEPARLRVIDRLMTSGSFEAILATLAAALAGIFTYLKDQPREVLALDAALFLAAALTARYPRAAGVALGAGLAAMLLIPSAWATLGEYAALIAVLGAGMRQRTRVQLAMIAGYGPLLILTTARDAPDFRGALMGAIAWSAFLGMMWAVGHLFTTVTRAHESQRKADLVLQRQQLTHELHDTVARSLTVVVRLAERMQRSGTADSECLAEITDAARAAHDQLRLVMDLLGDPTGPATPVSIGSSSLTEALRSGRALLEQHGFAPTITVEGDVELLSEERSRVLGSAAGEAFANLVKHGDPSRPSAVSVLVTADHAELTALNHPRTEIAPGLTGTALGLHGMRRSMAELGGTVSAEQIGSQWQTRITLPLAAGSDKRTR